MDTQTQHGFECATCGATFTDGVDAGHHEVNTGHRVTHADVAYSDEGPTGVAAFYSGRYV